MIKSLGNCFSSHWGREVWRCRAFLGKQQQATLLPRPSKRNYHPSLDWPTNCKRNFAKYMRGKSSAVRQLALSKKENMTYFLTVTVFEDIFPHSPNPLNEIQVNWFWPKWFNCISSLPFLRVISKSFCHTAENGHWINSKMFGRISWKKIVLEIHKNRRKLDFFAFFPWEGGLFSKEIVKIVTKSDFSWRLKMSLNRIQNRT